MAQILLSELRAGLASGKINQDTLGQLKAAGYTVYNDETPSLSDQARARHATLVGETQGQIDPQTGEPTYAGTGVMAQLPDTPLGGLIVGAAKGAGSTAYNLGEAVRSDPLLQTLGIVNRTPMEQGPNDLTNALQTQGGWQKAGKLGEQAAEFFVPGGSAEMQAAQKLGLLGRMGAEAASAAAVGGAQGENPLITGAAGAAGPLVSAGAEVVAPRLVNNLIGAGRKAFKYGANPGEGVVDQGLMAGTLGSLADKIDAAKDAIGNKIGTLLATNPAAKGGAVRINVEDLYKPVLDDAIQALEASGAGARAGIEKTAEGEVATKATGAVARIAALQDGINQAFTNLGSAATAATPNEAWQVSNLLKKAVTYGGNEGIEAGMPNVIRTIRAKISDAIADALPGLQGLNDTYQNLSRASEAVESRLAGDQGLPSLLRHGVHGSIAGMVGWATHNPALAAGLYGGMEALGTTPVATTLAQGARALGSEAGSEALARGGAAAAGALTESLGSQLGDKFGHDDAVNMLMQNAPTDPVQRNQFMQDLDSVYVNPDGTGVTVPHSIMQQFIKQTNGR